MITDFIKGFGYLLQGFTLIRQPSLFRYIKVPLICNLILFTGMLITAYYGLSMFSRWVVDFLPHWLQWLRWLILVLSLLFSGIALIYISTILVNIVAGPFNSLLSERVVAYLNATDNPVSHSNFRAL